MTPERRLDLLADIPIDGGYYHTIIHECLEEIERLQAPLPVDLKKRLEEMESAIKEYRLSGRPGTSRIEEQIVEAYDFFTTTIRALQAEKDKWFTFGLSVLRQLEYHCAPGELREKGAVKAIEQLQAELMKEQRAVRSLASRVADLEWGCESENAVASDKASIEEKT